MHGADLIRVSPVAPGVWSEECTEHQNKIIRLYRLHHGRKTSTKHNMEDIFYRCMLTSDPVILAFFEEELLKKRQASRPILEVILFFMVRFGLTSDLD